MIERLRYVRLGVADLEAASDFATRIVGLQRVEAPEGEAMFRSDARDPSLILHGDKAPATLAMELRDEPALAAMRARLEAAGHEVTEGRAEECRARRCKAMAHVTLRRAVRLEFVVRPQDSGWRYFGSRDAGITEFFGVVFASTDVEADIALWTGVLGGKVADYIGEGAYIALDDQHHRITILPAERDAILEVQYRVEGLHQVMQSKYFLESAQVATAHGPGRRPASDEVFLSFKGPEGTLFGYVAEGVERPFDEAVLPRQFPRRAESFCAWGSEASVPEYSA